MRILWRQAHQAVRNQSALAAILFASVHLLGTPLIAFAAPLQCEGFFGRLWRTLTQSNEFDEGNGASALSYRMVERGQGEGGETFLVAIRRDPGGAWIGDHEARDAFRGDPTWNFQSFSLEFMNRMGFSLNGDRYLIPTSDTLNARVAKLNQMLPRDKAVPFRFYTPSIDRVPDREYLTRFAHSRELPMASHGDEAFHDAHYHFATIALPPEIVEHCARQVGAISGLVEFVERAHPELLDRPVSRLPGSGTLRQELNGLISQGAKAVDAITAAPATAIGKIPHPFDNYTEIQGGSAEYLWRHLERGKSPIDYLRSQLNGQTSDSTLVQMAREFIQILERDPINARSLNLEIGEIQGSLRQRTSELVQAH